MSRADAPSWSPLTSGPRPESRLPGRGTVLGALCVSLLVGGCTTGSSDAPPTTSQTSGPGTSATSPSSTSQSADTATSTQSSGPPSTTATRGTTPTAPPTYFTPTDPSSYSMSGPISVEQALQDPFSNLLQRGALHHHTVTLDVVGTPDVPVPTGQPGTLLFGTCTCAQRGQGLHLKIENGAAILDAGGGKVRIKGTFTPVVTASDAITLTGV